MNNKVFPILIMPSYSLNLVLIVLYISAIKMVYEDGSKMSIEFLSSLLRCPNKNIFRSQFIQSLLDMKWNISKKYQFFQAICFGLFLIALIVNILFLYKTTHGVLILLITGCLIALYDAYQVFLSVELFLQDIFNYLDALRIIALIVYTILYFTGSSFQIEIFTFLAFVRFNSRIIVL